MPGPMSVQDLLRKLRGMPRDAKVYVDDGDDRLPAEVFIPRAPDTVVIRGRREP